MHVVNSDSLLMIQFVEHVEEDVLVDHRQGVTLAHVKDRDMPSASLLPLVSEQGSRLEGVMVPSPWVALEVIPELGKHLEMVLRPASQTCLLNVDRCG